MCKNERKWPFTISLDLNHIFVQFTFMRLFLTHGMIFILSASIENRLFFRVSGVSFNSGGWSNDMSKSLDSDFMVFS